LAIAGLGQRAAEELPFHDKGHVFFLIPAIIFPIFANLAAIGQVMRAEFPPRALVS
jgi:hypothetical protein